MPDPEPTSVTTLELYRQGARVESKVDRLDDKLDGHAERLTALEHRVDVADLQIAELKALRAGDQAGRRWGIGAWMQAVSAVVAVMAVVISLYLVSKTGARP